MLSPELVVIDVPNNEPENDQTQTQILLNQRWDNNVSNLEWATYSENLSHAYSSGLRTVVSIEAIRQKNYKRKLKPEQVIEIKRLLATGNLTHKEIASKFSVARSTIIEIRSGIRWKHLNVALLQAKKLSPSIEQDVA